MSRQRVDQGPALVSGIATVTGKRQLTIPAIVARQLGLRPGALVAVDLTEDGRIVLTPCATRVEHLAGSRSSTRRHSGRRGRQDPPSEYRFAALRGPRNGSNAGR